MKTIQLGGEQGLAAIVDDDDFKALSRHRWSATKGDQNQGFYAVRRFVAMGPDGPAIRTEYMSRRILWAQPEQRVKHLNGNSLDNRKENLRLVEPSSPAFRYKEASAEEIQAHRAARKACKKPPDGSVETGIPGVWYQCRMGLLGPWLSLCPNRKLARFSSAIQAYRHYLTFSGPVSSPGGAESPKRV
jgi:hypothetical protein